MHASNSPEDFVPHSSEEPPSSRILIGWKEYLDLPDWGIRHVKAKMDTGARTSALDVQQYEIIGDAEGGIAALLHLYLHRRHPDRCHRLRVPVLDWIVVRNSSGLPERRPLIETRVRLGPVERRIRLTVTNRSGMLFPMILGRTALADAFVVDVSQKYLLRKRKE